MHPPNGQATENGGDEMQDEPKCHQHFTFFLIATAEKK